MLLLSFFKKNLLGKLSDSITKFNGLDPDQDRHSVGFAKSSKEELMCPLMRIFKTVAIDSQLSAANLLLTACCQQRIRY